MGNHDDVMMGIDDGVMGSDGQSIGHAAPLSLHPEPATLALIGNDGRLMGDEGEP